MRALGHMTVRAKLGWAAGTCLLAVLALAASSIFFANRTTEAAHVLMERGIVGSDLATRLSLLMQQHKGLVGSAPAELDRDRLAAMRTELAALNERLWAELHPWSTQEAGNEALVDLARAIEPQLPALFASAKTVLDLAFYFVQDQSLAAAQGPYADASGRIVGQLGAWQDTQRRAMDEQIRVLLATSGRMVSWVYGVTGATLLTGWLAIFTTAGVLRRLRHVQQAMLQVAAWQHDVPVPYLAVNDEIGGMARAVQVFKVNALQVAEQQAELARVNERSEAALGTMSQGLCLYDANDRLEIYNEQFCAVLGLDRTRMRIGLTLREVFQISRDAGNYPDSPISQLCDERRALVAAGTPGVFLQELGDGRVVAVSYRPRPDGGWVATFEDVTARREAETRLTYMARHDSLTDLANRVVLQERLEQVAAAAQHGIAAAVLSLDLDQFKAVNDTLGHPIGDALLRAVAQRLVGCVRDDDLVTRVGGDEFAVILTTISTPEDAKKLAERINTVVGEPFSIEGHLILIGVSVGIAMLPGDGDSATAILRNADLALYRAKAEGRGTFCFFEPAMDERLQQRRMLELDLRRALQAAEFELYYQPLVNLAQAQVSSFEALLRWHHPQRGMVSPAEFIPLAEDLGLIGTIGAWVIRTACREAAHWPAHVKVAVNLSPIQFRGETLVATVREALATSGLTASRLELEITESVLLQNDEHTIAVLHDLRALGVRISLDDFGTGYSSLSYLRSFPFDKVKIDQSFVRGLSSNDGSIHIVRAVHSLCSGIGMVMTAEGVETEEQLAILRRERCMEIQGYLFSRPKPAGDALGIIERIGLALGPPGGRASASVLAKANA